MKWNDRSKLLTASCVSALAAVVLAFAPLAATSAPPAATNTVDSGTAAAQAAADTALVDEVNATLGLAASSIVTLDLVGSPSTGLTTVVPIYGEQFTLDLHEHSIRSPDYQVLVQGDDGALTEVDPQPVNTLRGTVLEMAGSIVAGSLTDEGLYARIIFSDEEQYWIEPIGSRIAGALPGEYVVYHKDDVIPNGGTCAADTIEQPLPEVGGGGFGDRTACGSGGVVCIAEIAIDADYQYYSSWGSVGSVENRVNQVINMVNAQYEADVVITHVITAIVVRTSSASNPYTTNDPSSLLSEFRSYWLSNHGSIQRDVAQLFTGRNLSGSVIGIAWLNGVCNNLGYSVVQSDCCGSLSCSADLSAHELGHNWSADHCSCSNYTMNASLTCANQFHPTYTQPQIENYRTNHQSCLDAGTYCDHPTFLSQPTPSQSVCSGSTVNLSVSVDTPSPSYQWQRGAVDLVDDGVHIFGATTDTLTIVDVVESIDEANDYRCEVTDTSDGCVKYSDTAQILVEGPVFTQQPQDWSGVEGDLAIFGVGVESALLFDFQWRKDGTPLSDTPRITGATTSQLLIYPLLVDDAGQYDCIVTQKTGLQCTAASEAATLDVAPPCPQPGSSGNHCGADVYPNDGDGVWNSSLDGDCIIDISDLGEMLTNYGMTSGATREDGDVYPPGVGDGAVDLSDLGEMLTQYGDNCN